MDMISIDENNLKLTLKTLQTNQDDIIKNLWAFFRVYEEY